jgi:hypothetical protein
VNNKELWMKMFKETDFPQYIEKKYKVGFSSIIEEDEVE